MDPFTVAIINENPELIEALKELLEEDGYRVATVHLGDLKRGRKDAVDFFLEHRPA